MKWFSQFPQRNNLDDFKVATLHRMRLSTLFMIIPLAALYFINLKWESGIAVKKNLYNTEHLKNEGLDSNFHVAKGVVPLTESNFLMKLLFYKGTHGSFTIPNWSFIDFIGIVILLLLMHFFIRNTIDYGPFDTRATYFLKWSMFLGFILYFIKMGLYFFLEYYTRNTIDLHYHVDSEAYLGYGWIFAASAYGFIINFFNYGRKLQNEVDLTV